MDLESRLNDSEKALSNDETSTSELQDQVMSLSDVTKMRIYVPHFPFDSITYNPDDNYRKSGVDPLSESIKELGRGIQEAGLQQPIGVIAENIPAAELKDILKNLPGSEARISMIFGNRRYLAMTNHTDITAEAAYVYSSEALVWAPTIAFIENMDRADVPLIEEAKGIYSEVQTRFGGTLSRFALFSGKPISELNKIYKIGEAVSKNEEFHDLVQEGKTKDVVALDAIARAMLVPKSNIRSKNLDSLLKKITAFDGKIISIRKEAIKIRDYADGKTSKLRDITKSATDNDKDDNEKNDATEAKKTLSNSPNLKALIKRIDTLNVIICDLQPSTIDEDLRKSINNLQENLLAKIVV